jgi:hypothetical protein
MHGVLQLSTTNIISRGAIALQGRHVAQITNALIAGRKPVS